MERYNIFVSSKISHYRDTEILELGAYPYKKGLKYSNANQTINELSSHQNNYH